MTIYDPGDIILVRFPFTDLTSSKQRPAIVLCSKQYQQAHGDIVCLALTSHRQYNQLLLKHWKTSGLPKQTWCKSVIGTLSLSVVLRRIGGIHSADYAVVRIAVQNLIGSAFLP
jgi:mRNA interferase MazF